MLINVSGLLSCQDYCACSVKNLAEPVTVNSETLYLERSLATTVYNLVICDLTAAQASGMPAVDQTGKVSLGAINTLLASVYLTSAGYPLQKTENYAEAAATAALVLPLYTLFTSYDYLHDNAHKTLSVTDFTEPVSGCGCGMMPFCS